MRYKYKVRELTPEPDNIVDVGEAKEMEAMSLKKLRRKLDHKKKYHIEYRNKKNTKARGSSHWSSRTCGLATCKSCKRTLGRSKLYSQRRLGESAHSEILNTSWARTRLRKTIHFSAIFWYFFEIQDFRSLFATPLAFRECRFCGFLKTSKFYITLAMIP